MYTCVKYNTYNFCYRAKFSRTLREPSGGLLSTLGPPWCPWGWRQGEAHSFPDGTGTIRRAWISWMWLQVMFCSVELSFRYFISWSKLLNSVLGPDPLGSVTFGLSRSESVIICYRSRSGSGSLLFFQNIVSLNWKYKVLRMYVPFSRFGHQ
jgi:hypothetical protein